MAIEHAETIVDLKVLNEVSLSFNMNVFLNVLKIMFTFLAGTKGATKYVALCCGSSETLLAWKAPYNN
ncbi:hypothetical protein BpHYR1_044689 [Brachionus plicatilis]|uniref:Uncharacterized protein n=1 Tax=Brachionus plicatilis TaxID=10195 RepID=A0A3M7PIA6_BRAPC|nr:hypothetical protein BpHYR1_044689 [Brachionus plicatilis]